MSLTRRQAEILALLREAAEQANPPPTLEAACALLGLRSRGSLRKHLRALIAEGYVEPLHGARGGIRLTRKSFGEDALPFLGKIAAGHQIEAVTQSGMMRVPAPLRSRRPCFVLQVTGDSMREAGILDGDYVVIEQRATARNGEIVVALVRGEDTTLKRIVQEPGRVILKPANQAMAPLEFTPDEVEIQGVLVGLMRHYG